MSAHNSHIVIPDGISIQNAQCWRNDDFMVEKSCGDDLSEARVRRNETEKKVIITSEVTFNFVMNFIILHLTSKDLTEKTL